MSAIFQSEEFIGGYTTYHGLAKINERNIFKIKLNI